MNYLVYIQNSGFQVTTVASVTRGEECSGLMSTAVLVVKPWVGSVCNSSTVLAVAPLVAWSDSYSSPLSQSISILHPVGVQASFRELMGKWVTIVTGLNTV